MNKEHKDPDTIDLNAPRHAQYMHNAWKKHQNTVYWVYWVQQLGQPSKLVRVLEMKQKYIGVNKMECDTQRRPPIVELEMFRNSC